MKIKVTFLSGKEPEILDVPKGFLEWEYNAQESLITEKCATAMWDEWFIDRGH